MSITIKHLSGPLTGETVFDDSTSTILIGRAPEAQIVYPEECIEVDGEHVKLVRDPQCGGYTIDLVGSCDVDLDGAPAETGMAIIPGSVITVGVGGPTFACFPSGTVIKHIDGPLAGQRQYFPSGVETITFGRPEQVTDISYPADYTKVGRLHFSLKRTKQGDYCVELTPKHYVEIDGVEADNGVLVPSGSTVKLGGDDGPAFSVAVEKPKLAGIVTEENKVQTPVRQEVKQTKKKLEDTTRVGAYALGGGLLAVMLMLGGIMWYQDQRYEQNLAKLTADLAAADAKVSALAGDKISGSAQKALRAAVYLIARKADGAGVATAWAFDSGLLATNAHVAKDIKDHERDYVLIGPNGDWVDIEKAEPHPGYFAFQEYKDRQGKITGGDFEPLNVISEYDVGILTTKTPLPKDPKTGEVIFLKIAPEHYLEGLEPGAAVASVGFPMEGMTGTMVVTEAPAQLRFGTISSLTDVFMCKADADHTLLIQHTVPVAGGVSGSPLIDSSGMVIGVVSGGNTAKALREVAQKVAEGDAAEGKDKEKDTESFRIPNAAMINFAQRADLLDDLRHGAAESELEADQAYWEQATQKFVSFFVFAAKEFATVASERYKVGDPVRKEIGGGTLEPRHTGSYSFASETYSYVLEPGHVYGFIADAKSGVRLALNVRKVGSDEFLRDAKDPRKSNVPELAPTAWVTVTEPTTVDIDISGLIALPAKYALYVYDWPSPAGQSAAEASTPAPSQ
jgi:Trypsin-like peptidase domain